VGLQLNEDSSVLAGASTRTGQIRCPARGQLWSLHKESKIGCSLTGTRTWRGCTDFGNCISSEIGYENIGEVRGRCFSDRQIGAKRRIMTPTTEHATHRCWDDASGPKLAADCRYRDCFGTFVGPGVGAAVKYTRSPPLHRSSSSPSGPHAMKPQTAARTSK
jgi:hypothetical protein